MTVFNAEEVKKCLEDVVGEDKEYALWLLEWAINKRSFDLEEYRKQIRAEVIEEILDMAHCTYIGMCMGTKEKCKNCFDYAVNYMDIKKLKEQNK